MIIKYEPTIRTLVQRENRCNQQKQKTGWVTEKKGIVVRRSNFAPRCMSGEFVFRGKIYSAVPDDTMPQRTIFRKEPVEMGSEWFYLEIKGYGREGRELYFQEHISGDVFYGMYLNNALRDFERMSIAVDLNLPTTLPIAVLEIPREEYIRKGMIGFQKSLKAMLSFSGMVDRDRVRAIIGEINEFGSEEIAQRLINYIRRNFREDLIEGIKFIVSALTISNANALLSGKRVGYFIKASKCPIRVGDPSDENIDTPEFREIAKSMGRAFRVLLENGILHHCPGTGNWTVAGELTDFSDTFDLNTEQEEFREHIEKIKKEGRIKRNDLEDFIEYLIGPPHTGVLCPYFLEGMFGSSISLEEATKKLLKIF